MYICLCVYIMYMYVHVGMYVYIMYVCMYVFVCIYIGVSTQDTSHSNCLVYCRISDAAAALPRVLRML